MRPALFLVLVFFAIAKADEWFPLLAPLPGAVILDPQPVLIPDRNGQSQRALSFTRGQQLRTNWKGVLGGSDRAISFWFKATPGFRSVPNSIISWGHLGETSSYNGMRFTIRLNEGALRVEVTGGVKESALLDLDDGEWHHAVVFVANPLPGGGSPAVVDHIGFFIDGVYDGGSTILNPTLALDTKFDVNPNARADYCCFFSIGARLAISSSPSRPYTTISFEGAIDDVAVWDYSLVDYPLTNPPTCIKCEEARQGGLNGADAVAWWPLGALGFSDTSSYAMPIDVRVQFDGRAGFDGALYPNTISSSQLEYAGTGWAEDGPVIRPVGEGPHGVGYVSFDGSTDVMFTNYAGPQGNSPRTIAFWVMSPNPTWLTTSTGNALVSWGTDTTGARWTLRLNSAAGAVGALRVEISGLSVTGAVSLADGSWHHVVVSWGGGSLDLNSVKAWVDGLEYFLCASPDVNCRKNGASPPPIALVNISTGTDQPVTIGGRERLDSSGQYVIDSFLGGIAEVKIWNSVPFTSTNLTAFLNNVASNDFGVAFPGQLYAYWPLWQLTYVDLSGAAEASISIRPTTPAPTPVTYAPTTGSPTTAPPPTTPSPDSTPSPSSGTYPPSSSAPAPTTYAPSYTNPPSTYTDEPTPSPGTCSSKEGAPCDDNHHCCEPYTCNVRVKPPKKGKKKNGKRWERGTCTLKCAHAGAKCGKHADCCGAPTGDLLCVNLDDTWKDPFTKTSKKTTKEKNPGGSGLYCVTPSLGMKLGEVGVSQSTTLSRFTHTILFSVAAACAIVIVAAATYLMRRRLSRDASKEEPKDTSTTSSPSHPSPTNTQIHTHAQQAPAVPARRPQTFVPAQVAGPIDAV